MIQSILCDKLSIKSNFKFLMKDLSDYHRNKRFRTTLANFHSYCHRQSQQSPLIIDARSKSTCDITNYKSIRLLRKKAESKSQILLNKPKKEIQGNLEDQNFNIKNADLIEIIKFKLQNGKFGSTNKQIFYKNYKKKSLNYKPSEYYQLYSQTSRQINPSKTKKKKVELIITNTKFKFSQNPKIKKSQQNIQQLIVTLQNRPLTAIQKHSTEYRPRQKYSSRQTSKRYDTLSKRQKTQLTDRNQSAQNYREISGWDLTQPEEQIFQMPDRSKKRAKKRVLS